MPIYVSMKHIIITLKDLTCTRDAASINTITYTHTLINHDLIKLQPVRFRFHHQAQVEVKILDALRRRDKDDNFNVIHMQEYFYFRNHLCITFELLA